MNTLEQKSIQQSFSGNARRISPAADFQRRNVSCTYSIIIWKRRSSSVYSSTSPEFSEFSYSAGRAMHSFFLLRSCEYRKRSNLKCSLIHLFIYRMENIQENILKRKFSLWSHGNIFSFEKMFRIVPQCFEHRDIPMFLYKNISIFLFYRL